MDSSAINVDIKMWQNTSQEISWYIPPSSVIEKTNNVHPYTWFPNGQLNTCYNAVDRHFLSDPESVALVWDSPVTSSKRHYTYQQLHEHVACLAGVYQRHGLVKGDVVLLYMPMVPEAVFAILACARLGVIHSVVFGGFAPKELSKRIDACKPKLILTASCGIEPNKIIPYKPLLEKALAMSHHSVSATIVLQRVGQVLAAMGPKDHGYEHSMASVRAEKQHVLECVPVKSEDPLYILYTSGTTGQPKGVVRSNGGHAVGLVWAMKNIFAIGKRETMFAASDIGWAVSHSCTIYGPLLVGATAVLYEGKPIQTPDAGAFWRIVSEYKVKTMFFAPTAARAIRREDMHGEYAKKYDLGSLKSLFLAGERSDTETLQWCQSVVNKDCRVIDNYWRSPVTALCEGLLPHLPIRYGSAGKAVADTKMCILMEGSNKESIHPNQFGNIVIKLPLPPTSFTTLWENDKGYKESYFTKYPGYYDTGDAGMIDEDGYVHVMSRTDDIINVAGHRLSTGTIEEIIASHPKVVECCVVPMPDKLKGHVPIAILVLKHGNENEFEAITQQLVLNIRHDLGAIACFKDSVLVSRLPKTRSGKILRRSIRSMLEGKITNIPATIEDEATLVEVENSLCLAGYLPNPKAKL
ncbi:hypothetical protein BDF14DRAFT_1875531 [Spinellus fusiger]|nr:hypothetical protein BDF14DRAFT_1875531 [Spinellus fusiger]